MLTVAVVSASLLSSCSTYYVASNTTPIDLYEDQGASVVGLSIPIGSALLMKPSHIYGYAKVRYHYSPTWYYVPTANLALVPNANPKYYEQTYAVIESDLAQQYKVASTNTSTPNTARPNTSNSSYDATIQTGPRGGKYYINKNGNKTYVKRSTPSGTVKHVGGTRKH